MTEFVRGYRPASEGTAPKMYDVRHLMLSPEATKAQTDLYKEVWSTTDKGESVPCVDNPEPYTSDDLPTDREAQRLCAPCPSEVRSKCEIFARLSRPAHGVHAGTVWGRELAEAMRDEED